MERDLVALLGFVGMFATGMSQGAFFGLGAVFAGAINHSGALEIAVSKKSSDSALAKMVELVAQAQAEKSSTQRFLEKAEQFYAAGVILFTIGVFLVPWLVFGEEFAAAFYRAMTVMVVASPCAIIISTPATVLSAIAGAARRGILIKGGVHLERASRVQIAAFDKTGTLTRGRPALTEIVLQDKVNSLSCPLEPKPAEMLALAAGLESKSEHPLAEAIVAAAAARGLTIAPARGFQSEPGLGARAAIEGRQILAGSEKYLRQLEAQGFEPILEQAAPFIARGRTCVWIAESLPQGIHILGALLLADTPRPESADTLQQLKNLGISKTVMLTGDAPNVARTIARETGVDEFHAGLLPTDKVRILRELKASGVTISSGTICSFSKPSAQMPMMKPSRLKVTAVSTRKPAIHNGWAISRGTKSAAVARMINPRTIDLVAAAPT